MKKLFNPLVTAIIGMFVGGLLVFVYFKNTCVDIKTLSKDDAKNNSKALFQPLKRDNPEPTPPEVVKDMIKDLYSFMTATPELTPYLFRRSYSLNFDQVDSIAKKYKLYTYMANRNFNPESVKIRIYPGLSYDSYTKKNVLSMILMLEKDGKMLWDKNLNSNQKQIEIQDQMGLCPTNCPDEEILTEQEWEIKMGNRYYVPRKK